MKPPNSSSTDFRPGRFRLPPDFQLWPDTTPPPAPAAAGDVQIAVKFKLWPDAFSQLITPAWPVTPPIPPTVASGNLITAVHENTVSTGIDDLWTDLQWLAANTATDPTTAVGDLLVNDGNGLGRLAAGANGQILTVDSSQPLGVKWAAAADPAGFVPTSRQIIAGAGLLGGGALTADVTLSAKPMGASGAAHSAGIVPDPGATSGAARYLREDATWGVPPGTAASQTPWLSAIDAAGWPLDNVGRIGVGLPSESGVPLVVQSLASAANETLQLNAADSTSTLGLVLRGYGPECGLILSTASAPSAVWRSLAAIYSKVDTAFLTASYPGDTAAVERVRILASNGNVGIAKSNPAYKLDVTGDVNISGTYRVNGVPISAGGSGSQTPWASDIDAASFQLKNAGRVAIGNTGAVLPDAGTSDLRLIVGSASPGGPLAHLDLIGNSISGGTILGSLAFANYNLATTDKRVAAINAALESGSNSGLMDFYTWSAGTPGNRMRITSAGNLGVGTTGPTARIHAVSAGWGPSTVGVPAGGLITDGAFGGGIGMIDATKTIGLFSTNGDLNFATGTTSTGLSTRMIMSAAGYLGVGRGPEVPLDVLGSGIFRPAVPQNATSGGGLRIAYDSGAGGYGDVLSYNWSTPGFMPLQIRGNPTVFPAGPVGIGARMGAASVLSHPFEVNVGANMNFWFGPGAAIAGAACLHAANDSGSANVTLEIRGTPTVFAIGNVGIGGSLAPNYPLSMGGIMGDRIAVWDSGPGSIYGFGMQPSLLQIYSAGPATRVGIGAGGSASFTEVLTVRGNGCVGIGYNSPADALVIVGLPGSTQAQLRMVDGNYGAFFRNDGATCYFMVTASGDPYGTWAPNYPWQVDLPTHAMTINTLSVTNMISTNGGVTSPKQIWVCSSGVASDYGNAAIQVRETNQAGAGSSGDNRYAPRIGFHWGGVVASQIGIDNQGVIRTFDNPGTGYAPFACAGLTVNAPASGVNAGLVVKGGDITVYRADGGTGAIFFKNDGSQYLYYTGAQFQFTNSVLIQGNCNISGQYLVNGAAFGGLIQIQQNGAGIGSFPTINFVNGGSGTLARCTPDTANNRALVAIDTPCDLRLKQNVTDLVGGLAAINRLRPVAFEYNGLCGFTAGERGSSVIAQELQKVLPDAVYPIETMLRPEDSEPTELLALNAMAITAHLILAIQELGRRLKAMEQRIN